MVNMKKYWVIIINKEKLSSFHYTKSRGKGKGMVSVHFILLLHEEACLNGRRICHIFVNDVLVFLLYIQNKDLHTFICILDTWIPKWNLRWS